MSDERSPAAEAIIARYGEGGPHGPAFYTFLVFVDRTDLPHVTVQDAENHVWRALGDLKRYEDVGTNDTQKLLSRAITLQPIDLLAEGQQKSQQILDAGDRARREAEVKHAKLLPDLLTGAKLDALIDTYERNLTQRAGVVVLGWWLYASYRRWRQARRARYTAR